MPELTLQGCHPEPLMSYLKALGIFRLVAEQKDPEARGAWKNGLFVLRSEADEESLVRFFLEEYVPTPVVVPWSGGDFFGVRPKGDPGPFRKTPTATKVIEAFLASDTNRLAPYRSVLTTVLHTMQKTGVREKSDIEGSSKKKVKARFLAALRSRLPDAVVPWMDAAVVIEAESVAFNALLGSGGGSDGNTHFSDNFMQNLWDSLPDFDEQRVHRKRRGSEGTTPPAVARESPIRNAIFGSDTCGLVPKRTASLFDSGAVGGPNAGQGMERESLTNPWDFILAIEGALCLAGAVSRRHGVGRGGVPAFPFSARMVPAGYGASAEKESRQNEVWLPLWKRQMGLLELTMLFSEGRVEVGRRTAVNGVDFARAVAGLGVDVGIREFTRYGIVRGRVGGENYNTAVSLGRFEVRGREEASLLRSLDSWLDRFRRACRGKTTPPRYPAALRRLDAAVFDFCRCGGAPRFAAILCALGNIERELSLLSGKVGERNINPVPLLSPDWISACDDGTTEFRIALALASVRRGGDVGPLRSNLEPVQRRGNRFDWAEKSKAVVWSSRDLCRNLAAVLERRVVDAGRAGLEGLPLEARYHATLGDICDFLEGLTDDRRIEELLWGAMLIRRDREWPHPTRARTQGRPLPRAYALLKLLFMPPSTSPRSESTRKPLRPEPPILARLRAGDVNTACEIAARRLRASGLVPMVGPAPARRRRSAEFAAVDASRLAAALLIPVRDTDRLGRLVIREGKARVAAE